MDILVLSDPARFAELAGPWLASERADPVSNAIYQRLGYLPAHDAESGDST